MESLTVGSKVTIAVMTAKTGGQSSIMQISAVKKTATVVLTIRLPGKRKINAHFLYLFLYIILNKNKIIKCVTKCAHNLDKYSV